MTLVIDLVRALREPEYLDEVSEELETDMTEYVRLEAADRIEALEARLEKAREGLRMIGAGHVLGAWVARQTLSEIDAESEPERAD